MLSGLNSMSVISINQLINYRFIFYTEIISNTHTAY